MIVGGGLAYVWNTPLLWSVCEKEELQLNSQELPPGSDSCIAWKKQELPTGSKLTLVWSICKFYEGTIAAFLMMGENCWREAML